MSKRAIKLKKQKKKASKVNASKVSKASSKVSKASSKVSKTSSTSNTFLADIVIFSLKTFIKTGQYAELPFKKSAPVLSNFAHYLKRKSKKIFFTSKKKTSKKSKKSPNKFHLFSKKVSSIFKQSKKNSIIFYKEVQRGLARVFKNLVQLSERVLPAFIFTRRTPWAISPRMNAKVNTYFRRLRYLLAYVNLKQIQRAFSPRKFITSFHLFEKCSNSFISSLEKNIVSLKKFKKWRTFKTRKHSKKKIKRSLFSKTRFLIFGALVIISLSAFSGIKIHEYLSSIPDPKNVDEFPIPAATLIYDRNNTLLYSAYDDSFRVPVPLSRVPKIMQEATIAAEDQRFYKHKGFDVIAIGRSIINNVQGKNLQGGSTITQQVAKNAFLSNKKTISRKIEEAIISRRLEKRFSKKQILELYFNTVSYGGNTIGIKTAALHYFGKEPQDLTRKEIMFLASITPAPSIFSQEVGNKLVHPERIKYVLDRMETERMINNTQREKIEKEKLVFTPQIAYKKAPHAVDYILNELEKKYGRDQVLKHGLIVKTTVDLPLQNFVQEIVTENVMASRWNNLTNTGVVIVSPASGGILAMVGSSDYYNQKGGQFNTVTAERQLGSTMKVITYARAFEDGLTPYSTVVDAPTKFAGYPDYKPRNYDGKFHGKITLRSAFANSYNLPALKLADGAGIDRVAELGYKMGIEEFNFGDKPKPLSMVIGGVEVSLINLVQAYSVVANGGTKVNLNPVTEVRDHNGRLIYRKEIEGEQIISKTTADAIFSVLSDNAARLPAFGRSYQLEFANAQVAVKTGTSNDVKDNVAIAFDKNFVVGVWAGNNDSSPMWGVVSGYSAPTLTMHEVVVKMLADYVPVSTNLSANLKNSGKN